MELSGTLATKEAALCVVDVNGVGYGIEIATRSRIHQRALGESVHLYTHLIIREDHWRLIGFDTQNERRYFLDLLSVNGVGAKAALAILSHLGWEELLASVREGHWKRIQEVPGVGVKLSQRIQLELAGKWQIESPLPVPPDAARPVLREEIVSDVVKAVMSLGYGRDESEQAVASIRHRTEKETEQIRLALQWLDSGKGRGHHGI